MSQTASHALRRTTARPPAAARAFLSLLRRLHTGHLRLTCPDGSQVDFGQPGHGLHAELQLTDWRACAMILRQGDIGFAEAWRDGLLQCRDLTALLRLALQNSQALEPAVFGTRLASLWYRLRHFLRRNSRSGSRRNIQAHYDLGNDFYRLWLDESWTYSSAWFNGDLRQPLARAQHAKYQRIIDTLALKPGMRVLEIGCGWGGFAEVATAQGIAVHGITLSQEQLQHARTRLAGTELATLALQDYRDLDERFDAIVSIEMFEAVGEAWWPTFFATLKRCLRPGGRALVQSITIDERHFLRYRAGSDFIQQFIFPGGMLPSVPRFEALARHHGLDSRDRLDFGRDYAETLRRWRSAFEAALPAVAAQGFDEAFIRLWRLYLSYCEAGFEEERIGVSQFLLTQTEEGEPA
ncbi:MULTISPECIES: cyclopropane-fatty-acyl-phospholipid synthase family protein [unclassified Paludibacterium]|uniref:SAM-dependent methyltransferase n=1 Tax=unclassified Paludibacterium TaxID=2618429 RepID=UPI001C055C05|nr:cyclopropane-fatty-acyl-phospholipid synthase family protein [Paludibacterium sp. B53371]BEV70907.1 cyclopropane-fatty-acyl-phospholipid synthase family protein [Paludibacterium sp. THUN1379]